MRNNKHVARVNNAQASGSTKSIGSQAQSAISKLKLPSPRLSITKAVVEPEGDSPDINRKMKRCTTGPRALNYSLSINPSDGTDLSALISARMPQSTNHARGGSRKNSG